MSRAAQQTAVRTASAIRARIALAVTATVLASVDLIAKATAERFLSGRSVDLGIQFRLVRNPGVAFGLGDDLPGWVVLGGTGLLTLLLAGFAWRTVAGMGSLGRAGLAALLAGAAANLIDRAGDGFVTDYLHTGWWPTFNLADVFITCGAALLVLGTLRGTSDDQREADPVRRR